MSWFSSIAGKAEQLLNQLDEAAASSLQEAGVATPSKLSAPPTVDTSDMVTQKKPSYEPVAQPIATPPPKRQQQQSVPNVVKPMTSTTPTWGSSWAVPQRHSSPPVSPKVSKSFSSGRGHQSVDESSLMEFLNSPSQSERKKTTPTRTLSEKRVKTNKQLNRASQGSQESLKSSADKSHDLSHDTSHDLTDASMVSSETDYSQRVDPIRSSQTAPTLSMDTLPLDTPTLDTPSFDTPLRDPPKATPPIISYQPSQNSRSNQFVEPVKPVSAGQQEDGSVVPLVEQENQRLRAEIQSLSDELKAVISRNAENSKVEGQLKTEVNNLRHQCSQLNELVHRMRSQEDDLTSALEARDSQIHILRTRLQESDEKTNVLTQQLENSTREKEQFLQDVGRSSEAQNHALLSVKAQLEQKELLLSQKEENLTGLKTEFEEREIQWNRVREEITSSLQAQGKELQLQQLRYSECHSALQTARQELQLLRKEHEDYKLKATSILQAKEKMIVNLQSTDGPVGDKALESVIEELRVEKYQLQSQLANSEQVILSLRTELQEIEETHSIEMDQLLQQVRLAQETLETERNSHLVTQDDLTALQKDLDKLKDEHVKEKANFVGQVREKDNIIEDLKMKVTVGSNQSDSGRRYLEERLREMTESLIDKQTSLESLTAQCHSLQLQLQRTETSLVEAQKRTAVRSSHYTALDIGNPSDTGANLKPMASILPSADDDTSSRQRHLRRVKTTLDSVDKIGLRIAWVLRRYPYVRLLAIGYILLLHI